MRAALVHRIVRSCISTRALVFNRAVANVAKRRVSGMDQQQQSDDYESWTKEALIERLRGLDAQAGAGSAAKAPTTTTTAIATTAIATATATATAACVECRADQPAGTLQDDSTAPETPRKRKSRSEKFDFSKFPQRKVAFKFSYFGWPYHGLARQGNALASEEKRKIEEQFPTVEGEVFKALSKCKLITNESECNYSRCGRTDRGVSGFGQVISLYVRSAGKFLTDEEAEGAMEVEGWDTQLITREKVNGDRPVLLPANDKEFPYINMLNKQLPPEIRILAWSPVKPDFDARFSCRSRFYRYFFTEEGLDIDAMKDAASRYRGQHDFRNFCRLDPAKQIANFERNVLDIAINPVPSCVSFVGDAQSPAARWWQLELRGTAFLWHQVRCMMAILFLVGQHLEEPCVVDRLLDVEQTPGKPEYEMAADAPLVLADCAFDENDVRWIYVRSPGQDNGNMVVLDRAISQQWGLLNTQAVLASALLENLRNTMIPTSNASMAATSDDSVLLGKWADCRRAQMQSELQGGARFILGGGKIKHIRKYIPLLQRKQAATVESRNKAWIERNGNKRAKSK